MTTPRIGEYLRVEFLDHAEGGDAPLPFVAIGRVSSLTRKSITLDSWYNADGTRDSNTERVTLVRSTIARIDRLVIATA